jgi:hypothetical protein
MRLIEQLLMFFAIAVTFAGVVVWYSIKMSLVCDDFDQGSKALEAFSQKVGVHNPAITFVMSPMDNELRFRCKYILAPLFLSTDKFVGDTILAAGKVNDTLSFQPGVGRQVIWKGNDSRFYYWVTSSSNHGL